jgi:hypothetical protein
MPYVGRDENGKIVSVSTQASRDATEFLDADAAELQHYLGQFAPQHVDDLARSDQALIRVIEDIVDTLIDKNLIRFTDLPEAAQNKLVHRRSLRHSRTSLDLLDDEINTVPVIKL